MGTNSQNGYGNVGARCMKYTCYILGLYLERGAYYIVKIELSYLRNELFASFQNMKILSVTAFEYVIVFCGFL